MEIYFGSEVKTRDGNPIGAVRLMAVDSQTLELTHLVVGTTRNADNLRLVPITLVQDAGKAAVDLRTEGDLLQYPVYLPGISVPTEREASAGTMTEAAATSQSRAVALRRTSVVLDNKCRVEALDGLIGNLTAVHLDLYQNRLASILAGDSNVPAMWISEIRSGLIKLATTSKDAKRIVGPEAGPYVTIEETPHEEEAGRGS